MKVQTFTVAVFSPLQDTHSKSLAFLGQDVPRGARQTALISKCTVTRTRLSMKFLVVFSGNHDLDILLNRLDSEVQSEQKDGMLDLKVRDYLSCLSPTETLDSISPNQ